MNSLTVRDLSFLFGTEPALRDINLTIEKGDRLALIGPNGSGKTTLLRLLSRFLPTQTGEIRLNERAISSYTTAELAKKIAFIASEQFFEFPFSVFEVVSMGRFPHLGVLEPLRGADRNLVFQALERTDLTRLKDRSIHHLSSGERQRVLLARALCQAPEIIMLDEPNAHLDIFHQVRIFEQLCDLNEKHNLTVIVVLHDLTAAARYCKQLALFDRGALLAFGTPREVLTEANLTRAYHTQIRVFPSPYGGYPQIAF